MSQFICVVQINCDTLHCRSTVAPHLKAIKAAVSSRGDQLTPREQAYVRAVLAYASGNLHKVIDNFVSVLIDHPLGQL